MITEIGRNIMNAEISEFSLPKGSVRNTAALFSQGGVGYETMRRIAQRLDGHVIDGFQMSYKRADGAGILNYIERQPVRAAAVVFDPLDQGIVDTRNRDLVIIGEYDKHGISTDSSYSVKRKFSLVMNMGDMSKEQLDFQEEQEEMRLFLQRNRDLINETMRNYEVDRVRAIEMIRNDEI